MPTKTAEIRVNSRANAVSRLAKLLILFSVCATLVNPANGVVLPPKCAGVPECVVCGEPKPPVGSPAGTTPTFCGWYKWVNGVQVDSPGRCDQDPNGNSGTGCTCTSPNCILTAAGTPPTYSCNCT